MVRWVATLVVASVGVLAASACAGRSSRDDGNGAGGNDAGSDAGGSLSGGSATTAGSSTGGTSTGGSATTGGSSTGGSTTGGSSTGGSTTGGSTTGGIGGAGAAGDSGDGGVPNGCTQPNPAGCQDSGCPDGRNCVVFTDRCIPSHCECSGGQWICTEDCDGGECRMPDCPAGCEPVAEGFCGGDGVTWICGTMGGSYDSRELLDGDCVDLGTQLPRYCCPASFRPECR